MSGEPTKTPNPDHSGDGENGNMSGEQFSARYPGRTLAPRRRAARKQKYISPAMPSFTPARSEDSESDADEDEAGPSRVWKAAGWSTVQSEDKKAEPAPVIPPANVNGALPRGKKRGSLFSSNGGGNSYHSFSSTNAKKQAMDGYEGDEGTVRGATADGSFDMSNEDWSAAVLQMNRGVKNERRWKEYIAKNPPATNPRKRQISN